MLRQLANAAGSLGDAIDFLKQRKLLASKVTCTHCQKDKTWTKDETKGDGFFWRCPTCRKKTSIRHGSFFSKSKLTLPTCVELLFCWAANVPVTHIRSYCGARVSVKTAIDFYNFLREVCSSQLLGEPILFGGPGVIVQIDESLFDHNSKVSCNDIGSYILLHFAYTYSIKEVVRLLVFHSGYLECMTPK